MTKEKESLEKGITKDEEARMLNFSSFEDYILPECLKNPMPKGKTVQLSLKIYEYDLNVLNDLLLEESNKIGKILKMSVLIRALIKIGYENKQRLEFKEN